MSFPVDFIIRLADIIISAIALIITFPILLLACIYVAFELKSAPIFVQDRVGKNGKSFKIFKVRSMKSTVESKPTHLVAEEFISNSGHILRRLKIDELPQFLNVLLGQMSVVGHDPVSRAKSISYR